MEDVYICELCLVAYSPTRRAYGPNFLKTFKGYTVDLRLQQFRKVPLDELPEFIDFASPKGKKLLAQMHEEVTR